jgi:hypothetical protein
MLRTSCILFRNSAKWLQVPLTITGPIFSPCWWLSIRTILPSLVLYSSIVLWLYTSKATASRLFSSSLIWELSREELFESVSRTGSAGSSLTGDTSLKVDAASFGDKLRAPRGEESYILFPRRMQLITKPYHSSESTPSSGQPTDIVSNAFPKTSEISYKKNYPTFVDYRFCLVPLQLEKSNCGQMSWKCTQIVYLLAHCLLL